MSETHTMREKKEGERVKRRGKGRNTKHKGSKTHGSVSSSTRRRRRLATLLFNALPREERSSSLSCENTPPPLCVCVSTDRTTRLLISLSFDRNFSRNKLSSVWKNSAKNPTLWFCTNAWRCVAFSLSSPRERRSNSNVIIENSKRCSSLPSKGFKARERLQLRELELKNVRGSEHWRCSRKYESARKSPRSEDVATTGGRRLTRTPSPLGFHAAPRRSTSRRRSSRALVPCAFVSFRLVSSRSLLGLFFSSDSFHPPRPPPSFPLPVVSSHLSSVSFLIRCLSSVPLRRVHECLSFRRVKDEEEERRGEE